MWIKIPDITSLFGIKENYQGQLSGIKRIVGDDAYREFIGIKLLEVADLLAATLNTNQLEALYNYINSNYWLLDITELKWAFDGLKYQLFNKYYQGGIYSYLLEGIKEATIQIWENREMAAEQRHNQTKERNVKPLTDEQTKIGR